MSQDICELCKSRPVFKYTFPEQLHRAIGICRQCACGTVELQPGEKISRNAPCPCGSGKKWKKCHGGPKPPQQEPSNVTANGKQLPRS